MGKQSDSNKKRLEQIVQSINIVQTMNEIFWVGDENDCTIYANPVFEKLSGYKLAEIIGKPFPSFFDEESQKILADNWKIRKTGKPSRYEATMVSKKGKNIPLLISGSPVKGGGAMGICTDLTKIKKLSLQEHVSEQIIRHSQEAIVVLDKDRNVKMWNSGATQMFGFKEKEILGEPINFIIPPDEKASNTEIRKEVEEKGILKNYETKRATKNGQKVDVSISVSRVSDDNDALIGYLVIYRDITDKKRIHTELQKRFEAIQDAYKELGLQKRQADYIFELAESATGNATLQNLTKLIVSASCMLTKCDAAILRIYNKETDSLKMAETLGVSPNWKNKDKIPLKNSLAQEAFETGRAIIIHDISAEKRHQGIKLAQEHDFQTLILIPLTIDNKPIGTISLYATNPGKFRLIETDFLQRFSRQCSLAIFTKLHCPQ